MIIGVPKEIKEDENRVALTPSGVAELVNAGHKVLVESGAGSGSWITDKEFKHAGAQMIANAEDLYSAALIVKVKEPVVEEYARLRKGQILFCFLHLAPNKKLTNALAGSGVIAIGYETVELKNGNLPLLAPMSEVAGRLAPQVGAQFLEAVHGGRGVLLGGVAGVPPAKVTVLGGGIVGRNAALIAVGMGASVTVIDKNLDKLRQLEEMLIGRIATRSSNTLNISESVAQSNLVIGAALTIGAKAPTLVTEEMVKTMMPGSVIVDVAIDQGGTVETSKPTTHSHPITKVHDILHYGVTNIPSAVPRTSTFALTNSSLPWVLEIANLGWRKAAAKHPEIAKGLNIAEGKITHPQVAEAQKTAFVPLQRIIG